MQPVSRRVNGLPPLSRRYQPSLPRIRSSAVSRTEQVLMTTRSASPGSPASSHPSAARSATIASDSALFIWQPYVSTNSRRGRSVTSAFGGWR